MEGFLRNEIVSVWAPQPSRRTSTDSERSLTPSQIQVSVQVGTRWDKCVALHDSRNVNKTSLNRNNASHSCPDLSGRTPKSRRDERKPSDVDTLSNYSSSLLSAGAEDILHRWSSNFNYQEGRKGSLPLGVHDHTKRRPSAPPLVTSYDTTDSSPPPDVSLGHLISRRDSRKLQDLGFASKGNSFLKVPTSSGSSSGHSSPSAPISPKMVLPISGSHETSRGMFFDSGHLDDESPTASKETRKQPSHGFHNDGHRLINHQPCHPHQSQSSSENCGDLRVSKIDHTDKSLSSSKTAESYNDHRSQKDRTTKDDYKDVRPREVKSLLMPIHFSNSQVNRTQKSCLNSSGNICQVMDGLFLGNIKAAYCEPLLCKLNIECIVDLSNLLPVQVPPSIKSNCPCTCSLMTAHQRSKLCINIQDSDDIDISLFTNEVNKFIEGSHKSLKSVLVYSYHGKSRAPAIVIQYLMTVNGMSFNTAFSIVKTAFPCIDLNAGFHKTLLRVERSQSTSGSKAVAFSVTPRTRSAWN